MFWVGISLLAVIGGVIARGRVKVRVAEARPQVDDDTILRIEREGVLDVDEEEPLVKEEIERAEEEFWDEYWDEPEEF